MENPPNSFPREECGSKSITTPAYFVILQQSQGNGKKEEGIVVANRDVSSVAPVMSSGHDKSKSKTFLSAECKSGNITLTLDNNNMWNEFYRCSTEMVLTKQGRRMFPYCRYWISGLDPYQKYILVMDISPMDNHRYKWNGKWWEAGGKSEPHVLGRVFIHPESPSTGQFWMHQPVSFYKLKLTNNILDQEGHIILHSMHRYLPRLHLVPANQSTEVIQLNGPDVHTFTFPQTEFIAVTAYQNFQITQLKIDCNPFAKGFREGAITGKPVKEAKSKNSDQENDSQGHKSYNDSETLRRLRELFRAPENSDGDTEPEALNAENAFLNFKHSRLSNPDTPNIESDGLDSPAQTGFGSSPSVLSSLDPKGETNIVIKEEPVDDYDYSQEQPTGAINVKQESEEEETDEYSNSDDEYPILERHFSQFRKQPHSERKRSASSPTGVAKAKMLKLNSEKMPVVYLESCSIAKSSLAVSTLEKTIPREKLQRLLAECRPPPERELCTSKHITTEENKRNSNKGNVQNLSKNKADTRQITVSSSQVLNIGSKKPPIVLPKSALIHTTGLKYNLLPPVKNKRGRPRKQKHDEAEQILPDVNPDLEDVDGVLFVAFSSKEALDVHTEGKPKTDLSSSFLALPASGDKATINKIRELEKHLVEDLQTMKYNQVIHPALQQVGLKLNIVDPTMSIDLRYLGVQLPLPYITRNVTWDSYESCAQASRSLFVSRTGKTTDYTKIKGWKDKFSTSSMPSSSDNHSSKPLISGKSSESSLKNRSAFCSDELDEYLENEARLMETSGGITQNEREPPVISWLPAESTSSVKNIDTLLQRQISEPSFSSNASKTHAKRKRTKMPGKASTPKTKAKQSMESENIKGNPVASETGVTSIKHLLESDKVIPVIPSLVPSIEETLLPSIRQVQLPNQQPPLRSYGFSKAHMKLLDMEESTLWKGKPRTYITEERADIGLVVLLTAQASLKNKQIHKVIRKQPAPCNKLFCRLGCVCQSLNHKEHSFAHCRRADCMLDCSCIQKKQLPERDEMQIKVSMACTEQLEEKEGMDEKGLTECMEQPLEKFGIDIKSSAQCSKQLVEKDVSSIRNSAECMEQLSEKDGIDIDLNILADCVDQTANQENPYSPPARDSEASVEYKEQVKTVKTQSSSAGSSQWYSHPLCLEQFPIWKRGEEEADSEPICIPKQSELEECKVRMPQTELQHSEKHTSPVTSKNDVGSSQPVTHKDEPVYVLFDSLMTCARVRIYERKPPEEKAKLELCNCESPDANEMDHSYKRSKSDDNYKTKDIIDYIDKNTHNSECFAPTKLIEIISDCSWEEDRSKILNIVSQHMNKSDSQSFKVGSFNIELTSENKDGDNATTSTYSSRVKISMVPGQMKERDSEKSVKWKTESIKLPECKLPEPNVEAEQLQKSHGGKGLPFYTKIIPAGKLVAQLKNPNERESELVQVNGKYYPQAKVLLGQMGALHPANRLAAYITHRLRPGLFNLSKLNEVKINAQSKDEKTASSSVEGKFKENPSATLNVKPSITKNIVPQPALSNTLTQLVLNEVGTLHQKTTEITALGAQKIAQETSPSLLVVTSVASGKQAPALCSNPSAVSLTNLAGIGTISPSQDKALPSMPALISITKLLPKETPVSAPPGLVLAASGVNTQPASVTAFSKPQEPLAPLPSLIASPLVKTLPSSSLTTSTVSISVPSTSIVSQLAPKLAPASTVRTLGSSPSLAGTNAMPTLTLKPAISQATSQVPRTSVLPAGIENRLGPRLLLIPVQSGSTPVRPVQPIPQTPGQKMILQPIRSPGKLNLFRHPNGQIIQLVPLQQVRSTNVQPSNQPLVVRKKSDTIPPISAVCLSTCTSAVTGVRLQTKSETFATAPTPTVSASLPSVSVSTGSLGSLSKICSVTTAVSVASAGPPFLSQLGTLKLRIVPPISSDAENQSNSKVITCASEGQSVSSTNVLPLQSGSFSLLKLPSQTAESSPVSDITISQASNTVINTDSKSSMPPEIQGDQKLVDDTVLGSLDCTTCDNSDPGFSKPDVTGSEVSRKGNMSDETSTSLQQNGIAEPVEKISEEEDSSEDKQHSTEVNDKSKTDKQRGFNEHDQSKEDRQHSIEENDKNKEGKRHVIEEHDKSIDDKQHGTEKLDKSKEVKQHSTEEPDRGKEVKQHDIEELDKSKEDKQHVIEEHGQNIEDKQHSIEEHNQNIEDKQCGTEQQDKSKEDNQHGIEEYDICKENKPHHIEDLDNRKDKQHSIGGHEKSEEDKQHDIEEQEKNKDPTVDSGFPKPADEIQLEKSETLTQDPVENLSQCYTDQKSLSEPEQEASAASFLEENPEDSDSSICKEMFECITRPDSVDSEDSKKDTQSNASLDNENSEIDEAVDIETVEELSEKINIARLKASASNKYSSDKCSTHAEYLKARKKLSKDGDMFMREMEEDPNEFHRRTHTANERRRRNEMRDLFEELKNALGLHNLPKVSKSYILKQAIEEIEGLTDLADTLIRKKTLLSQRQNHLLKKVSNLSGKTKDVILKKLEYIYAKQKAMEAERKKKNLEEDIALHKASMINAPLQKNMSLPPMGNEEAVSVQLSGKSKKPIILAKKTAQASIESKSPQQISITASNLLMTPQGQLVTLKNPVVPGHVAAVQSTVIQAEMSPQVAGAVQQGIASVVIQLPGTIQVKGLLGNASIPITLAAVPNTSIAGVPPPTTEAERDDLSMMPKIVNVTSLAHESSVDLDGSVGLNVSLTDVCKNDSECPLTIESSDCGATSVQGDTTTDPVQKVSSANPAAPTQPDHLSEAEDGISQLTNHVSDCIESSLIEHITQEQFSQNKEEMSVEQKLFSVKDSTCKANKSNYEHSVELESNKVASGIDDPDLETSELIDVIGDHEDTDETITSLLNELAFLNQQLNTDDLDSGSDFPGSETASRGSASKFTEGDSSPFSFGRLKELSEMKEKNVSLSPLFLQLEEGEIQEGAKQNEEPEMVPFLGSSSKESLSPADGKTCSVPDPSVSMPSTEMSAKQETLWRPMPKLAPLGLKAAAISADQKAHGSRSMPTLAPVNMRLNPPKSSEEQSKT